MIKKIIKNKKGYTIIETMIAISLFIIIIMAGMGALLNANLLHQKSRDMRSILDNMSFVMEDISRNLRTGYNFHCIDVDNFTPAVLSTIKSGENCWGIAFESQDGSASNQNDQWVYFIRNDGKIFKATSAPYTNPDTDPASQFIQLTPDEVVINSVSGFSVLGAEAVSAGNRQQPFVLIRLVGLITYKNVTTPFSLQTSASQRLIDVGN
jgi:hypothetical protein